MARKQNGTSTVYLGTGADFRVMERENRYYDERVVTYEVKLWHYWHQVWKKKNEVGNIMKQ